MASKLFGTSRVSSLPKADAVNHEGAPAYKLENFHALCQVAATGTFTSTFYDKSGGQEQLDIVNKLAQDVAPQRLAKLAVYAREKGLMKDMPIALLLILSRKDTDLFHRIFNRVVNDGRTMRTFFQMLRSGKFGSKGLSYSKARAVRNRIRWAGYPANFHLGDYTAEDLARFERQHVIWLLSASVGVKPSYKDILRCLHFKPFTNRDRAINGWLCNYQQRYWAPATYADLPEVYRIVDAYRKATTEDQQLELMPLLEGVRWDLLSSTAKGPKVWQWLAKLMGPMALRMNLNTLGRHGVFQNEEVADLVARRLSDADEIRRSRSFPFSYFMAYLTCNATVPQVVKTGLHSAAEHACGNIPELNGPVVIGIDVSSSMTSPVTGERGVGTSKATCVMVASLFGAALWRKNPGSILVPFNHGPISHRLDPNDSLLSIAERVQAMCTGGTDTSIPLEVANSTPQKAFAGCVIFSDNESWVDPGRLGRTSTVLEWDKFERNQKWLGRFKEPKYVGCNLQPNGQAQNPESKRIMNIGGFSDGVFDIISAFMCNDEGRFVKAVDAIEL